MKRMIFTIFLLVLGFYLPDRAEAARTLQAIIDAASKETAIELKEGEYNETVTISKPITLVGKGNVLLRSCTDKPIIAIRGEGVILKNIKVEHCGDKKEDHAVYVTGSNHILAGMDIVTRRAGIKLDNATNVAIKDSVIAGKKQGNGIDLWKSIKNNLSNIKISNVTDGIYLEQSDENTLFRNSIQNSRYGMHLMFSNDNLLNENVSKANSTGAMLMESNRTVVSNNKLSFNSNSVHAQGLLLYMVSDTKVTGNTIISNRVGIYIEEAERNQIENNTMMDNFIGIQFEHANGNTAKRNTFIGNVNNAQAIESASNQINGNYWDAASKVDATGNGVSKIPFTADPYLLTMTTNVPEYQLFFQSPGLILLQKMLKSPADQLLIDSAPLMDMTNEIKTNISASYRLWIMSTVMIIVSFSLFIYGRKRS
ncbi:right-handed parallel beta-helix repeat-containing protein [Cytobacillus massiliigabonensis]|uniref:right-handed parallel beta-helix repeat-containing protein n=1 Tax=Cytobacillus massiliigabonensis TaxID=1871011 RepID=UPI000C863B79|nr:NosD domain-containing protein [Cytobacillus massiliigabonensis]